MTYAQNQKIVKTTTFMTYAQNQKIVKSTTFMTYNAQNQKIVKSNHLKVFGNNKIKGPKHDSVKYALVVLDIHA